jgi:hypothetical protein
MRADAGVRAASGNKQVPGTQRTEAGLAKR